MENKEQDIGFLGWFAVIAVLAFALWGFISFVVFVGGHILGEDTYTVSATSTMSMGADPCANEHGQGFGVIASTTDHPYVLLRDYGAGGGCYKLPVERLRQSDFINVKG